MLLTTKTWSTHVPYGGTWFIDKSFRPWNEKPPRVCF